MRPDLSLTANPGSAPKSPMYTHTNQTHDSYSFSKRVTTQHTACQLTSGHILPSQSAAVFLLHVLQTPKSWSIEYHSHQRTSEKKSRHTETAWEWSGSTQGTNVTHTLRKLQFRIVHLGPKLNQTRQRLLHLGERFPLWHIQLVNVQRFFHHHTPM
jgi:hypothetical protein